MKIFSKRSWPIFFFILGVISILGQGVILREITTLFYGNELYYGLGLGLWLCFTGLGSITVPRIKLIKNKSALSWLTLSMLFISLPFLIILIRYLISKFVTVGQLPNMSFSFFILIVILFIFCFPLGALFSLSASIWSKKNKHLVNTSYFWETVGFAFAGLFFSFILATTSFPLPTELNNTTLSWRYPGLTSSINSKYNQIIITQKNGQSNFYLNGQLAVTSQEKLENKQFFSLITPFVKDLKSVLILGNPNITHEIRNKFPQSIIDYLETDKELVKLEKDLLATEVKPIFADIRNFFNQSKQSYDLIIFSPGNPQTLLTNRYFTRETFKLVTNHLNQNGIFALSFYIPTDYQSQEATHVASSIYQTLKSSFPEIELITLEDQIILLSGKNKLAIGSEKIDPSLSNYFWYQIKNPKRNELLDKINNLQEKINSDFEPVTFFYQQLFWQTMFNFNLPGFTIFAAKIIPFVLLPFFLIMINKAKKGLHWGYLAASSGFVLMGLETLIILIFQSKIGFLYSQICLIFAAVLSGMSVGVITANYLKKSSENLLLSFAGYLAILFLFSLSLRSPIASMPIFLFGTAFITGLIGGIIFSLVNTLYLKKGYNPGFIYAFDLFGGSIGAISTSSVLLPIYGVRGLILGFIILLLVNLIIIAKLQE